MAILLCGRLRVKCVEDGSGPHETKTPATGRTACSAPRSRACGEAGADRAPALLTICVVGTCASLAACVIGGLPPSQLGPITTAPYLAALLAATLLVGLLPPLLLHKLRRPGWKRDTSA